ncbi:Di-copper centre-containing protein [Amylostereum chailletii]|nr:Di-copper centre-containing protein [Amylostereum chailletii]
MRFSSVASSLLALGLYAISSYAACTSPTVRREWRQFTTDEKSAWISAVKCLNGLPHDDALTPSVDPSISNIPGVNASGSYYDDFVYVHMDLNTRIHNTGLFLPWHRWYVAVYEGALKEKCGYTGSSPYWDWSIDAPHFFESDFWADSDPTSGLGGFGDPNKDFSVPDGAFSDFHLTYPSPHILRRNLTLQPYLGLDPQFFTEPAKIANTSFTAAEVSKMVNGFVGDYKGFQTYFEGWEGAHGSVHLIMGGDLGGDCPSSAPSNCTNGPTFSANEPLFWMHHAMVDKVWYDWQQANTANAAAFKGGSVQALENATYNAEYPNGAPPFLNMSSILPADGLFTESTIQDVFNTTAGILCYVYE